MFALDSNCLVKQAWRGMHCQQRTECRPDIFLCFSRWEWPHKTPECNAQELLNDLVADNTTSGLDGMLDQLRSHSGLVGFGFFQLIYEDICIQKESTAHSSHPV